MEKIDKMVIQIISWALILSISIASSIMYFVFKTAEYIDNNWWLKSVSERIWNWKK